MKPALRFFTLMVVVSIAGMPCVTARARHSNRAAQPQPAALTLACKSLRPSRMKQVLHTEIQTILAPRVPGFRLRVEIHCRAQKLSLRIVALVNGREARRTIVYAWEREDRERLVGLAVAQLLIAQLPRLTAPGNPPPTGARAHGQPPSTTQSVRSRATPGEPVKPITRLRRGNGITARWSLAVATELVLLDFQHPLVAGGGGPLVALRLARRWELTACIRVWGSQAQRSVGQISVLLPGMDLGVRWHWLQRGRLLLSAGLRLGGRYIWMRGEATEANRGLIHHGPTGEAALELGATWRLKRIRLGVGLTGGAFIPGQIGTVVGDDDVRLSGFWLSLGLALQFGVKDP